MNRPALPVCLALLLLCSSASALTNLYSTRFERSEGYDPAYELYGQKGWTNFSSSVGGNGLITNYLGTQAAYIGLWPLDPEDTSFALWQPLDFSPVTAGVPLVTFTVSMEIVDSTNTNRDDFWWTAYNSRGQSLFTLSFYNVDLGIYYLLDGTNDWSKQVAGFTNDTPYDLTITMDFAHNRWAASLSGLLLLTNQPITTTGALLDLADMDAIWYIGANTPGDNFMIFDNYKITADALTVPSARISCSGFTANGQCLLHVSGTEGARFAIDATTSFGQWSALKTNVITGGYFDYIDPAAPGFSTRFYRARLVP